VAQRALPPGAIRRRAIFGLLDADGWGYAGLKATFWFLLIIFLLGYVPNLAYYVTVSKTVDVGYDFLSVVNWCPTTNGDLPCPVPTGAMTRWQPSPKELALPAGRADASIFQSGTHLYLIGGRDPDGPIASVLQTTATIDGNFAPWSEGPALPEPRVDAALVSLSGVPYLIGGRDASGDPTATVYQGLVEEGLLTGWRLADGSDGAPKLTLSAPVSGASAVAAATGVYLFGGHTSDGLSDAVLHSTLSTTAPAVLGAWERLGQLSLPEPRADAAGVIIGETIYIAGGEGPDGATRSVYRLELSAGEPSVDPDTDLPQGWAIAPADQELPEPRADAGSFTANGVLYVLGGRDAAGDPQASALWAVPDAVTGDLPGWRSLDQTTLPEPRAGAPIATIGSFAFIIGGEGTDGLEVDSFRANLSPAPPFFRLGAFGVTVPALAIEGEIGQQLGYINAMGVGMTNFAILVLIAWAFSHRAQTLRLFERLSRGRFKAPREDEFRPG
jgi:hypothetical protein